jgi:predicted esterase
MRRSLVAVVTLAWRVGLVAVAACRSHAAPGDAAAAEGAPPPASIAPGEAPSLAISPRPSASLSGSAPGPTFPAVTTDWCIDGFAALGEDVCALLPPMPSGRPRRLLVYLHGIVPPVPDSPQKRTFETAVLHACQRAGVAALLPRGRRGIGPGQERDWWAWPTTSAAIAANTPSLVARWAAAKKKLEELAGAPFDRTYLAGSSNGAYYLAALAVRGDLPTAAFPVDGFGAMSGGAAGAGAGERLSGSTPRPFYVGFGTYDEDSRGAARNLVTVLTAAHWPVKSAEHPLGHGANEAYLDEAFAFWEASD